MRVRVDPRWREKTAARMIGRLRQFRLEVVARRRTVRIVLTRQTVRGRGTDFRTLASSAAAGLLQREAEEAGRSEVLAVVVLEVVTHRRIHVVRTDRLVHPRCRRVRHLGVGHPPGAVGVRHRRLGVGYPRGGMVKVRSVDLTHRCTAACNGQTIDG